MAITRNLTPLGTEEIIFGKGVSEAELSKILKGSDVNIEGDNSFALAVVEVGTEDLFDCNDYADGNVEFRFAESETEKTTFVAGHARRLAAAKRYIGRSTGNNEEGASEE